MAKITAEEARQMMRTLPGWQLDGETLRRQFTFHGFADAVAFAVRLGFDAEAADHHPGILIEYKRVTLGFTTHSAGGLTSRDFDGARAATALATRFGADGAHGQEEKTQGRPADAPPGGAPRP